MKNALIAVVWSVIVPLACSAKVVTKTVDYSDGPVSLKGYLAYDDAKTSVGKVPGVLVVPEWWGLSDYAKHRAEMVAKLGYVAFVADMYGEGKSSAKAADATAWSGPFYAGKESFSGRAHAAVEAMLKTDLVDSSRVAAIGYCFGGTTCLSLAFSGEPLVGIVGFHAGLIPVPADAAAKTKAKILLCQGAIDPFITPAAKEAFLKSMDEGKFNYEWNSYSGAVHAFTNKDADALGAANGLKGIGYNEQADRRSWEAMRGFLREVFATPKA